MNQEPLQYADFVNWFPEFEGIQQSVVIFRLGLSNDFLQPSVWGKFYQRACALLTAHYLWLRYDTGNAIAENGLRSPSSTIGFATSKTANTSGLSESYATNAMLTSDNPFIADLARTEYGLEFLNLLYTWIPACGTVFSPDSSAKYWNVQ